MTENKERWEDMFCTDHCNHEKCFGAGGNIKNCTSIKFIRALLKEERKKAVGDYIKCENRDNTCFYKCLHRKCLKEPL
jgi:hypothetical protein